MIDLHCHFLPGIDDGARSMREALALAQAAVDNGIRCAIMTPHLHPGRHENTRASIAEHTRLFRAALKQAGIRLRVGFAAEVRLAPETLPMIESGEVPFLGRFEGHDIMLLEFPHSHIPLGADKLVQRLLDNKIRPLIAHPERNKDVIRNLDKITPFVEMGCLLQLTAGSIANRFGEKAQARAEELLESDARIVIATDSHNLNARPPLLREGWAAAAEIVGHERAYQMVHQLPLAIVSSQFFQNKPKVAAERTEATTQAAPAKPKPSDLPDTVDRIRIRPLAAPAKPKPSDLVGTADRTHVRPLVAPAKPKPSDLQARIADAVAIAEKSDKPKYLLDLVRDLETLSHNDVTEKSIEAQVQEKVDAALPGAIQDFLQQRLTLDLEKELIPAMRNSFKESLQQDLASNLQQVLTADVRDSLFASIIQEARNEAYAEFRNRFKNSLQQSLIDELINLLKVVHSVEDTSGLIAHLQQVTNEAT